MSAPNNVDGTSSERPKPVVKLGPIALKGPWAYLPALVLLASVVTLIVYSRPTLRMLMSGAIWILLIVYWNRSSRKTAPTQSTEAAQSRQRHQQLLNLAILLFFVPVPGLTHQFLWPTPRVIAAGFAIQIGSAIFYLWAQRYLGRYWSSAVTIMKDHQLIRSGPYRLVRHPLYTGMIGMFVGTAIVSGQYHALIGVALGLFAYLRKIRIEERALREVFGSEYDDYKRHSWTLIPWLY